MIKFIVILLIAAWLLSNIAPGLKPEHWLLILIAAVVLSFKK